MEEKMIEVGMYADQTGLFSESELSDENWCEMLFPEWLVRKWFEENHLVNETSQELKIPVEEATFELWLSEVSYSGDTDGLYLYALQHGVKPAFNIGGAHYVFWRDDDNFKTMVFEGSYDECREFMKERDFIWITDDEKEYELEVE
jgi:hypothetical protein